MNRIEQYAQDLDRAKNGQQRNDASYALKYAERMDSAIDLSISINKRRIRNINFILISLGILTGLYIGDWLLGIDIRVWILIGVPFALLALWLIAQNNAMEWTAKQAQKHRTRLMQIDPDLTKQLVEHNESD